MKSVFKERERFKGLDNRLKPGNNKTKHIGLELEIVTKVTKQVLDWEFKRNGLSKYINIGLDSSITPEKYHPNAYEVRCLIPQIKLSTVVKKMCEVLQLTGSKANKTCGMHVHLDMRKRKVDTSYTKLVKNLPFLTRMVNSDRVGVKAYNSLNKIDDFKIATEGKALAQTRPAHTDSDGVYHPEENFIIRSGQESRNSAINPYSYKKYKTLEVRLHEGTIDDKKIVKWVNKLVNIVDNKKEV